MSIRIPVRLVATTAMITVATLSACKTQPNADSDGTPQPVDPPYTMEAAQGLDAAGALARLEQGNARYTAGEASGAGRGEMRRGETGDVQYPFATVICCSDSRVSPEVMFDAGIGDLFVIRIAGNVVDDHAIGSIEYAAHHLHTPLVVVLGHEGCGAVTAATQADHADGHIDSLVKTIRGRIGEGPHDDLDDAVITNARMVAAELRACEPFLKELVESDALRIVAARYDLDSGSVDLLD